MDFKEMFSKPIEPESEEVESTKDPKDASVQGVVEESDEPKHSEETKEIQVVDDATPKSITDINLSDVKVKIDTNKSAGEQTEEVIDFVATVTAAQDKATVDKISQAKKEEIVHKAEVKAKEATVKSTEADTEVQKAKREKFELLYETFGVTKHIPDWLLKVLMCIFAPFYVIFVIVIGIPTGFIRFLIDCIDGILIRYDNTEEKRRPKIKVTVWVILSLIIVAAVCLTTLACLHII